MFVAGGVPSSQVLIAPGSTFVVDHLALTTTSFNISYHADLSTGVARTGPNSTSIAWDDELFIGYTAPSVLSLLPGSAIDPLSITGITLPDGNTPESEGFISSFDSGLPSPNQSVPEPSGMCLVASGALALLGYGRRWGK
jgi:hypothetical protein